MMKKIIIIPFIFLAFKYSEKKSTEIIELNCLQNNIDCFINSFINDYDTLHFKNNSSVAASSLDKGSFIWNKNIEFNKKKVRNNALGESYSFRLKGYYFKDSISCNKSFNLWMRNFGTYGIPIEKGVNYEEIATIPILSFKMEKIILFLSTDCSMIDKEQSRIKKKFRKIIKQYKVYLELNSGCGGPLYWESHLD